MYKDYKFDANKEIKRIIDWIKDYFADHGPTSCAVIGMSGGKDSTVAAALCAKALGPHRVFGVIMPNGKMNDYDMECAIQACEFLKINYTTVDIGKSVEELYTSLDNIGDMDKYNENKQVITNTPSRIRMATLYAIAAMKNGRVVNTCNLSEDYIGWATKFGDAAGDFKPIVDYTATEVITMGEALRLPNQLIYKVPDDGMSGKSDEENFGFTYEELDKYIRENIIPSDATTLARIKYLNKISNHKRGWTPYCRAEVYEGDEFSF